jgi:hypothetical protein
MVLEIKFSMFYLVELTLPKVLDNLKLLVYQNLTWIVAHKKKKINRERERSERKRKKKQK